jgi:hypothetical protein
MGANPLAPGSWFNEPTGSYRTCEPQEAARESNFTAEPLGSQLAADHYDFELNMKALRGCPAVAQAVL